jgi:hypothetical protein
VIHDIYIYFLPVYLVCAIGYGVAVHAVAVRCEPRWRTLALLAMILVPLVWGARTWPWIDQQRSPLLERSAREVLAAVPDGSVLVVPDYDRAAVLWYLTIGERTHSSVHILHLHSARGFESAPHEYAARVRDYLLDHVPLNLPVERRSVNPGAKVFLYAPYAQPAPPPSSRLMARLNPSLYVRNAEVRREERRRTFAAQGLRLLPLTSDLEEIVGLPSAP